MVRVLFATMLLLCSPLFGQVPAVVQSPSPPREPTPISPQVDVAEVLRRGDMVIIAGEGPRGADEDAMKLATLITSGVRKYASKMSEQGYPKIQAEQPSTHQQGLQEASQKTPLWGKMEHSPMPVATTSKPYPVVVGGAKQFTPEPSA